MQHYGFKKKYIDLPLWTIRLIYYTQNLSRMMIPWVKYPLADSANTMICSTPLFIVGAGRSGTTLLRSMLVASGQIAIPPETQVVHIAVRRFVAQQHLKWQQQCQSVISIFESHPNFHLWDINLGPAYGEAIGLDMSERSLARIIDVVYGHYVGEKFPDAKLWGDQSPVHTFHLKSISAVFPQAKYLHMLRDGRDAIASHIERSRYVENKVTLNEATYRWKTSIKRMQVFKEKSDFAHFLEIRYEDLVTDPVATLKKICDFLGINYTDKMTEFWNSETTVEHLVFPQHRNLGTPLFTSSIGRWKERLTPEEQKYVLAETSELLELLGYI